MRQGANGRRARGRSNRKPHAPTRSYTFDSNGPDVRVRGNAHQVYEKYLALARDAYASGDRIGSENFYQHAEHYYRLLNDSTDPQPNGQQRRPRDGAADTDAQQQPPSATSDNASATSDNIRGEESLKPAGSETASP